jgi:spore germination cell wall hydrolase CwlJ-like protein
MRAAKTRERRGKIMKGDKKRKIIRAAKMAALVAMAIADAILLSLAIATAMRYAETKRERDIDASMPLTAYEFHSYSLMSEAAKAAAMDDTAAHAGSMAAKRMETGAAKENAKSSPATRESRISTISMCGSEQQPKWEVTEREKEMMACVMWNADHADAESMACVAKVILNRMDSPAFPSGAEAVMRQKGQFEPCDWPAHGKAAYREWGRDAALGALEAALMGYDPFGGEPATFYAAKWVRPERIAKGLSLVREHGGHRYWKKT